MQKRLDLDKCRELLGPVAQGLGDEVLTQLRDGVYDLSNTLADVYEDFRQVSANLGNVDPCVVDLVLNSMKAQWDGDEEDFVEEV